MRRIQRDIRKRIQKEAKIKRRKRRSPCLGKIRYDTPEDALIGLKDWREKCKHISRVLSGAYKCVWCPGYHLTSKRQPLGNYLEEPDEENQEEVSDQAFEEH